jgi:hypothetical protein
VLTWAIESPPGEEMKLSLGSECPKNTAVRYLNRIS